MFGYLKLDRRCPKTLQKQYKKYYCYLCRELNRHYGVLSRFLLSYDVTFFLLFCTDGTLLNKVEKIPCFQTNPALKKSLSEGIGQRMASLNLLLTNAKIEDNILDEGDLKARAVRFLLGHAFKKAERNEPEMHKIISEEYESLRILEKENCGVEELEESFAKMMTRLAKECFGITDERKLNSLSAASRWLYFIDAVDDLDEDIKEKTFNPLKNHGSFSKLKNQNYNELFSHIKELYKDAGIPGSEQVNDVIINRLLFYGLPEATVNVLSKRRAAK